MRAIFEVKHKPSPVGAPQRPSRLVHLSVPDGETAKRLEAKLRDEDPSIAAIGSRFSLKGVHEDVEAAVSFQDAAARLRDAALGSESF